MHHSTTVANLQYDFYISDGETLDVFYTDPDGEGHEGFYTLPFPIVESEEPYILSFDFCGTTGNIRVNLSWNGTSQQVTTIQGDAAALNEFAYTFGGYNVDDGPITPSLFCGGQSSSSSASSGAASSSTSSSSTSSGAASSDATSSTSSSESSGNSSGSSSGKKKLNIWLIIGPIIGVLVVGAAIVGAYLLSKYVRTKRGTLPARKSLLMKSK